VSIVLHHSPADITRAVIIANGNGSMPFTDGTPPNPLPVFVNEMPNNPEQLSVIYDADGQSDGRAMVDGEEWRHEGVRIIVRDNNFPTTDYRARKIRHDLTQAVNMMVLVIGSSTYLVHCFAKTRMLRLGKEKPSSQRELISINAYLAVKQVS
jgi:hypothetical protein